MQIETHLISSHKKISPTIQIVYYITYTHWMKVTSNELMKKAWNNFWIPYNLQSYKHLFFISKENNLDFASCKLVTLIHKNNEP